MKISRTLLLACTLSIPGSALLVAGCASDEKSSGAIGSIRPEGKLRAEQLPALTKISYETAQAAANAAAPGHILEAELEVEDGNLQYAFDVVGTDGSLTEVEIDAGNGKVLATDRESASDAAKAATLAAKASVRFDAALKTALDEIPGTLLKGKLEEEHGRVGYEFKILGKDGKKAGVEVDATTGKVLKTKKHGEKHEGHDEAGEGDKKD